MLVVSAVVDSEKREDDRLRIGHSREINRHLPAVDRLEPLTLPVPVVTLALVTVTRDGKVMITLMIAIRAAGAAFDSGGAGQRQAYVKDRRRRAAFAIHAKGANNSNAPMSVPSPPLAFGIAGSSKVRGKPR